MQKVMKAFTRWKIYNIYLSYRWLLFAFSARSKPERWRHSTYIYIYICTVYGTYHSPSQNDQYYFDCLDKALDVYISYKKVILMEILTHRKVGVCLIHFFINMIQKIYSKKSISKTQEIHVVLIHIWQTSH